MYETCEITWDELHNIYLASPNETEWKQIANLSHCPGAIDGKHIRITWFKNSGSVYYNN